MSNDIIFTSTPKCDKCRGKLVGYRGIDNVPMCCVPCDLLRDYFIGVMPKIVVEREPGQSNRQLAFKLFEGNKTNVQVKGMLNLMPHTVSDYRLQYNDINGILGVTQAKKIQKGIALELYNQGIDTKDIILQTGLSIGVVRKIIVTSSMFKSKQKIRDKEILRMADRGISLKYIAKKFSVSVATVKHVRSKKIT